MKLFWSSASPFARKCRVVLRLKGLLSQFDEIECLPMQSPPELLAVNPIAQVPALVLNNGKCINNSPLICAYIDRMSDAPSIYGNDELEARRLESIGDAIMENAVKLRMEVFTRDETQRSKMWQDRWHDGLRRAFDIAEKEATQFDYKELNIGKISIVCAMGFLDFRFPDLDWRGGHDALKQFCAEYEAQDAFSQTAPK